MIAMLRPATPADRPDLIALALAEDAAWSGGPEVSAEEAGEFIDHHGPGVIFERDGRVAGYGAVGEGGGTIVLADPGEEPGPALEALAAWVGERGHHEVDTYAGDARRIAWLEAHGFTHRRSSFDLQRGINPPLASAVWPSALAIARYRRGEDDDAVHALIYSTPHGARCPDTRSCRWKRDGRCSRPTIAAGSRAATGAPSAGSSAACSATGADRLSRSPSPAPLAVSVSGRALLLHSLAELRSRGATSLALGVQAENEKAIALYRDIDFEVAREWRVYARPTA